MVFAILTALLGLAVGSFINALEYRIENKMTISGHSICPSCKKEIKWFDLVPVVSWIVLRGKCRSCGTKISFQYPLVESITAVLFVLTYYYFAIDKIINGLISGSVYFNQAIFTQLMVFVFVLIIFSILILVGLYDAKTTYILSTYVYFGIIFSIILELLNYHLPLTKENLLAYFGSYLLCAIIPALYFFSLYFFSKGAWMGLGDTELAILLGLFLGWPKTTVAYFFAFIVGSVWGLVLILRNRAKLKTELAFGPFLVAGTFFAFLFGQQLFNLYVKIFLGV